MQWQHANRIKFRHGSIYLGCWDPHSLFPETMAFIYSVPVAPEEEPYAQRCDGTVRPVPEWAIPMWDYPDGVRIEDVEKRAGGINPNRISGRMR